MRAGLLSQPTVIKFLQENYICTWSLPGELDDLKKDSSDPEVRRVAALLREQYRPLVEIVRLTPNGELGRSLSMNKDILEKFKRAWDPDDSAVDFFIGFLNEGRAQD